jgi:hypothetical protein
MSITKYQIYEGAVLYLIAAGPDGACVKRVEDHAYCVNDNICIYVKYSVMSEKKVWPFDFAPNHQKRVKELSKKYYGNTFIVLVCHNVGVCALPYDKYQKALNEDLKTKKSMSVHYRRGAFQVKGLDEKNPDFPRCLF